MLKCAVLASLATAAFADLRMAAQTKPKRNWKVKDRGQPGFVPEYALYMEPSAFNYRGLEKQRDGGGYDQFLRSNIDNEQDKRNFSSEDGKDHLPFRSYEAAMTDASDTVKNKIPTEGDTPGSAITVTPDVPFLVPLRWNNPHASELEVNIWVMDNKYVVPVRKPTCAGEGRQDATFTFTVPKEFNELGDKIPDFAGCKKVGDCVLQVYAHSVESRMYSMGTPLIVEGTVPAATATGEAGIAKAGTDNGLSLEPLRPLCLPSNDASANIAGANLKPQFARLISDVYNHAYQNSDYSPYHGQQPENISRNMQASVILKMVPANRGELGRALLKKENPKAYSFQRSLLKKADRMIRKYESITNKIIAKLDDTWKTEDETLPQAQETSNCFRCAEVGSVTTRRKKTNTYVPSFLISDPDMLATAKAMVPDKYKNLINERGELQIYMAALADMNAEFVKASEVHGLHYLPPPLKSTTTTMADATNFKKRDANGNRDRGEYAAKQAAASGSTQIKVTAGITEGLGLPGGSNLGPELEAEDPNLPDTGADPVEETPDMDALMTDSNCDDDDTWTEDMVCDTGTRMFDVPEDLDEVSAAVARASPVVFAGLAVVFAFLQ